MINIKNPEIIKNVLTDEDFYRLSNTLKMHTRDIEDYDEYFGRYSFQHPIIEEFLNKLVPLARKIFNSDTLISSYAMYAHYEGKNANLYKHKDDNACTYTIDLCLYQSEPWDLWVDDIAYTTHENEAVIFYGNDQLHWREKFPNPESGYCGVIFFHFIEPDHWWNTYGPSYINVIRKMMTEEEWKQQNVS
jgi:hypothetical protein